MTVEDLIKSLRLFRQIHGNLEVTVIDPYGKQKPLDGITLCQPEFYLENKTVLIADSELLGMFNEFSEGFK